MGLVRNLLRLSFHCLLSLTLLEACLVVALTNIESRARELQQAANDAAVDPSSLVPHSRRKRSVIFPTGSDLEFTVAFQIPLQALSATSKWEEEEKETWKISRRKKLHFFSLHPRRNHNICRFALLEKEQKEEEKEAAAAAAATSPVRQKVRLFWRQQHSTTQPPAKSSISLQCAFLRVHL